MQCKTQRSAFKHNALCFQFPCIEEEADSWSLTELNATKHTTDTCIVNQCAAAVVCYETHCNWFAVSCVAFRGSQSLTGENVLEEELSDHLQDVPRPEGF